jgi:glycosyltransferase involved in cell wall biosynthesis
MNDHPNICLLSDSFPPLIDGVANAVLNYADIIQRKYGGAIVAAPNYPGVIDGYPYRVVRYPSLNTMKSIGYRTGIPYWPGTVRELSKCNIDVIHCHCPFISTLIARSLRSSSNAPIIFTYHTKYDIDIKNAIELGFMQTAAIKFIVSNIEACDEVWVVSEGAGENLRSLGYRGSYLVMENGADFPRGRATAEELDALSAEYGLEPGLPVFLFVGRMMWYKGVRIILEGLHRAKVQGLRFKMLLVGDGFDFGEIKECAAALRLTDDLIYTGLVKDRQKLRAIFSRADMFLFPSTFDTSGLVVREAAACGLPSVLVRGSCAAEGVTDGRNGVLIEENAASLADAILRLSRDRDAMKAMGQKAMDEVFVSWEDAVGRAAERYHIVRENYKNTQRYADFQDNKLYKLADDIENAMERLRQYREKHKQSGKRYKYKVKK